MIEEDLAAAEEEPAEAAVPQEEAPDTSPEEIAVPDVEIPVTASYTYQNEDGYIESWDGWMMIDYPGSVTADVVSAFLDSEISKYSLSSFSYSFSVDGNVIAEYPAGYSTEERKSAVDTLPRFQRVYAVSGC